MKNTITGKGRPYTVIYDGDCKVCSRSVELLAKLDRNRELEMISSQSPGVRERFAWITPRAYVDSIQVVRNEDGRTWQAAAALEELLNVLPKGRLFSWMFEVPLVRPLADEFYRWFARNRYKLGCDEHCVTPGAIR
jgi:predicted DCC family thiol-disulfide oxidoreductase YuxK